jgi:hypothetical protein
MRIQYQPTRSEMKFEINESRAGDIRQYLFSNLKRDAFSQEAGGLGYPVCSVYLDSPDGRLCGQTMDGKRNRYKLRVRIYDALSTSPAFVEIKRRDGQAVKKQRAMVDRKSATEILAGQRDAFVPLAGLNGQLSSSFHRESTALNEFCRLRDGIHAVGVNYVSYLRDAYVSPDGMQWRATFDRQLQASPYELGSEITIPVSGTLAVPQDLVVFELKFTNRFPYWMQELVRVFNLTSVSFPKYVNCRQVLGQKIPGRQTGSTVPCTASA